MCVDEEHVRALAYQAAEWHKPGIKPVGSAGKDSLNDRKTDPNTSDVLLVATAHIVNKPDPKNDVEK